MRLMQGTSCRLSRTCTFSFGALAIVLFQPSFHSRHLAVPAAAKMAVQARSADVVFDGRRAILPQDRGFCSALPARRGQNLEGMLWAPYGKKRKLLPGDDGSFRPICDGSPFGHRRR
jgi:hypothetical protein